MKRLFCLTIIVALIPLATYAQGLESIAAKYNLDADDVKWQLTEEQLVLSLNSSLDDVVLQSLHNTIVLSIKHRDRMNVNRVSNSLIRVHKRTRNPVIREAALAALLMVGSDRGLLYARNLSETDRHLSQALAFNVIDDYVRRHAVVAASPAQR